MTAAELIGYLKALPPDTRILVRGYEGGYNDASAPLIENRKLIVDYGWDSEIFGEYDLVPPSGEEFDDFDYGVVI